MSEEQSERDSQVDTLAYCSSRYMADIVQAEVSIAHPTDPHGSPNALAM